jgi:hypothetical protein
LSKLIPLGPRRAVPVREILTIAKPGSVPLKRWLRRSRAQYRLTDLTGHGKARSVLFLTGDRLVLSSLRPQTIAQRLLEAEAD